MQNFFDQFDSAPSAAPQAAPAFIPGTPKQMTPQQIAAEGRASRGESIDYAKEARDAADFEARQEERNDKQAEKQTTLDEEARTKSVMLAQLKADAKNINRLGKDANDNGGWGETGMIGSTMRSLAGTAGYSLGADLDTFKAKNAFAGLAGLAAQGVKLTPVSNEEIKLAASSIANLDPNADHETFMRAVDQTKQYYYDAIARIDPLEAYQTALDNKESAEAITAIAQRSGGPMPDPEILAQAVKNVAEGGNAAFAPPEPPSDGGGGGGMGEAFYAALGDVAENTGDLLGIVGNPLNAGINAVAGTNLSTDLGKTLRDVTGAPDGNALASAINKGGLSALSGVGIGNAVARQGSNVIANALASQPVQQFAGGVLAGASADLARQAGAPAPLQAAAGLAGGIAGFGGASALMRPAKQATEAAEAFKRQGVNMLPADAGGTAVKILNSGAKASPLSAGPIRAASRVAVGQLEDTAKRAVNDIGGPLTTDKAGEAIRQAGQQYVKNTSQRGERLYTSAYKAATGVKAIKPINTIAAIDEQIARLKQNPDPAAASTAKELQAFKTKLEGGVAIQGLRDARTGLSQGVYDGKLRSGTDKGMWKKILSNVADDIDAGLRSAGKPEAAALFKRADKFWSERVEQIDSVLQPILGKEGTKGGEQILASVESMARGQSGGNARLSRLLAEMPEDYANQVRATIIERIGKATPGAQTAQGDAFAPSTFLTNWNKLTPQGKASLFSDTKLRRNLDDIALISDNMKSTESFTNFSNTAMAVAGGGQSLGAIAVATMLHPVAAAGIAGTQFMTGKALASPRLAEWLARTVKVNNQNAMNGQIKRLDAIAAAEPIIANDIASIKQFLANSPGLSKAAASDEVNEERPVKP